MMQETMRSHVDLSVPLPPPREREIFRIMNSSDDEDGVGSPIGWWASVSSLRGARAGSVGTELVDQLLRQPVELVRVIDNDETGHF